MRYHEQLAKAYRPADAVHHYDGEGSGRSCIMIDPLPES